LSFAETLFHYRKRARTAKHTFNDRRKRTHLEDDSKGKGTPG